MLRVTGQLSIVLLTVWCHSADAAPLSGREFDKLARDCAPSVAPSTLAAIAKVESDFDPLAVYDNTVGKALKWNGQMQSIQGVKDRLEARHSIDVGLMQINSSNFPMLGLTPDLAFDPCISLSAAAQLIERHYAGGKTAAAEQLALRRAISAYNTGDLTRGFTNGYVRKVELAARQIVPALLEAPTAPGERQIPKETWDVWGSYERDHFADTSSGPLVRRNKSKRRRSFGSP